MLWVLTSAWAKLPSNNQTGEFWADQSVAAQRFGLTPFVWSYVFAVLAVVGAGWFVRRGWGAPVRPAWTNPPPLDPQVHRRWLVAILVGFVVFYSPGFFGAFNVYDDPNNIWDDEVVRTFNWENLKQVLFHNHRGVNQEWMFVTLQLCYALFGKNYAGFFILNLALLPVLLLLVHQLALLLVRSPQVALLAVVLYGFSPIVAELVCWMLERGHYFGLIFALASCVAYLQYLDVRDTPGPRRWWLLAASVAAYVSCQFGKPAFLYVPVWLVLFDALRRRTDLRRAALEKLPFAVAMGLFLLKILEGGKHRVKSEFIGGSISNTLALDANQVLEYVRASFFPLQTGVHIPWNAPTSWFRVSGIPDVLVLGFSPIASLAILVSLVAVGVTLALRYRWPWLLFAGVAGVVSVGPEANLPVHTVVMSYRYTHSMHVLAMIVWATALVQLAAAGSPLKGEVRRWLPLVVGTALLTLGVYQTQENRFAWSTPTRLWTRSAWELYPNDGWSGYYAGKALMEEDRNLEAIPLLHRAIEFTPDNVEALRRLGHAYHRTGQKPQAARFWKLYFNKKPSRIDERYTKLLTEVGLGDYAKGLNERQQKENPKEEQDGSSQD